MPTDPTTRVVDVPRPDVTLSAWIGGAGPLVVLLHGFPDTWRTWDAVAAVLRRADFRTAALALRGYVPSGVPRSRDYRLAVLAADVVAFLDRLGAARAHIVGHDWGASAAYALAALHPSRVERMVTLAIPPLSVFPSGCRERIARPHNAYLGLGAASAWLLRRDGGRMVDRFYQHWSPSWAAPEDHLAGVRAALAPPDRARAAVDYYAARTGPDEAAVFARAIFARAIAAPTLAIYGSDEPVVRRQAFDGATNVLGLGSRVVEMPGVGHWPHLEAPAQVADMTVGFLQGDGTVW